MVSEYKHVCSQETRFPFTQVKGDITIDLGDRVFELEGENAARIETSSKERMIWAIAMGIGEKGNI